MVSWNGLIWEERKHHFYLIKLQSSKRLDAYFLRSAFSCDSETDSKLSQLLLKASFWLSNKSLKKEMLRK